MKLSAIQAKLFFRRAQRRFKVSNDFINRNMTAMLKFIQYAITPRIVLKRKLIRKRNRVFLRHNYLRKLIFDPTKFKKRRHAKRLHSQWSKRLVLYLRRYSVIEFVEEQDTTANAVLTGKDVSEQLKEQLELLKSGKRTVPLLDNLNNLKQAETIQQSIRLSSIDITCTNEDFAAAANADDVNFEENSSITKVPLLKAVHITEEEFKGSDNKQTEKTNGNFLDMLISKVKNTADESGGSETLSAFETSMEPPKPHNKVCEKEATETEERENSNSSSDFFGFEDNERVLGNFPGMLSTPLVRKRDLNSAFVSETLNAYMRDNSLESSSAVNYPQRRPEDGQVLAKSIPPKLDMPALPEGLQGLRTVAERRTFLQRTKNTKYCIINNIGTIFRELQKKSKGHRIYKQAIESVMNSSSVPMTRQGWKAAAWLLTEMGNYYCQTITIDGENFRLYGGRGNFRNKFRKPHSSHCKKLISVCPEDCIDRINFRSLRPFRTPEKRSKLNDSSKKVLYKPCPLSQKILRHSRDEESVFCSLDIVRMPQVKLEVFPQLQRPLSEIAKKYLQLILPYGKISREWAEFSVSTLLESQNMELETQSQKSFTFNLPYANDRNHLIIRRVYKRSEEFDGQIDSSNFSFRREIDQKIANGEPPDLLSAECADILSEMLNSVVIACSENSFIKDDPDNIYQYVCDEDMMEEKSVKKIEQHQQQTGISNKKQSRLLMELKRLNATVIDAATSKSKEDGTTCDKECCKLGCFCSSLSEGHTVRQHCGKQRCVLECKCKCPSILRLETDGRKITTEDAFMLRRQATAKLARVEKEFTSTVVLTGSETLLINESQYDKKRRCTKIPKRYGDFVEHDDPDLIDCKPSSSKRSESISNIPLEPVLVNDIIYNHLKHSSVKLKKLHDVKDLVPWCMIHMVYKCFCKGQSTFGHQIVIEKHEERPEAVDESSIAKSRTLYSFETEECKKNTETYNVLGSDTYETSETSEASETVSDFSFAIEEKNKIERRGRISDNHYIDFYMNAKANHCRRVVPIPKNIYKRRNKKRVAHIQLYIAENESDETRLSLNEHVLRSVYYHKDINGVKRKAVPEVKEEENLKDEEIISQSRDKNRKDNLPDSCIKLKKSLNREVDNKPPVPIKKRRMSMAQVEKRSSLLIVNHYKESLKQEESHLDYSTSLQNPTITPPKFIPPPVEQITIPKISQIFSLNTGIIEMETETSSPAPVSLPVPTPDPEPASAIDIAQGQSDDMALAHGVSSEAFKNVFKQVIKNMNNLVSKKMQDIDMALRRESKAIPAPNAEILCIIRWNNFLEAYLEGFVYLWEVRTASLTFIAATIKPIMPLVMNALSVVNIQAILRDKLPLLGRMLVDRKRSASSEGLAVVMQGQKMYWIVKGFLRPDKTRICPKPTPESHPLLTRKINVLCRLLINNQFNEHKKRQDALQTHVSSNSLQVSTSSVNDITGHQSENICSNHSDSNIPCTPKTLIASNSPLCPQAPCDQNNISLKLKVLPMQRNISDQATSILEQMVSQAYGFVRTNISFRKIRNNELCEIFPPAKMNSNHHWLVLDISNDFSHIFIPELKDLLTLDRIQKVMTYALAKNRIVKMQFSQKSLFNAYVTPKSQRKLYFGPYRHSITTPKLVLLQSVDGQMMLREVYESRHKIIPKIFSTTAFWVVQKGGKMYLDVEQEHIMPVQVNEHETEDVNGISLQNNSNMKQTCSDEVQKNVTKYQIEEASSNQLNIPVKQTGEFNGECQMQKNTKAEYFHKVHQSGQTLQCQVPEKIQIKQGSQIEQRREVYQFNEALSNRGAPQSIEHKESHFTVRSAAGLEKEKSDNVAITNRMDDDDDDDCMIVDDEPCSQSTAVISPVLSRAPLASEVVPTTVSSANSQETNAARINYTISYAGEKSSLVVIQNECDRNPMVIPDVISKTFTIMSDPQSSAVALPEIQTSNIQQNLHEPMPINTIFSLSSEDCRPLSLKTANDVSNPGEITIKNQIESSTSNIKDFCSQSENKLEPTEIDPNSFKLNEVSMKLNKNITIKKITTEAERNPPGPLTYSRNGLCATSQKPVAITSSSSKLVLSSQKQKLTNTRLPPFGQAIAQVKKKTNFPQHSTTSTTNFQQRPMVEKIISTSQQNLHHRSQGGLIVRTPSTINTTVKSQQPISIGNPGTCTSLVRPTLHSVSAGVRLRTPSAITQIVRLSSGVSKNVTSPLHLSSISTTATPHQLIRKSLPESTQSQQKDVLKRMLNPSQHTTLLQKSVNKISSTAKSGTPPSDFSKQPQFDPLHISEGYTKTISNNLPQPKFPNGINTETEKQNPIPSQSTSVITVGGIKRNSIGIPINRAQFRLQPIQKLSTQPISTVGRGNPSTVKQVKGIPIELPRLKKFAIVSPTTQNTTVITPPTSEISCESGLEASITNSPATPDNSAKTAPKKLFTSLIKRSSSNETASTSSTGISSIAIKSSASGSLITNAEYGYFHANLDGLPKFVVKRVGEDFLIKVPNFNGILKLTGWSTVHNYLNQYTTQKCGKTNEEIANLKWTFKAQDRSKLNIINKSNSPITKPGNNTQNMLKLFSLKKNLNEKTTSPASIANKVKLQSTQPNQLAPNDSIDLSDDEKAF